MMLPARDAEPACGPPAQGPRPQGFSWTHPGIRIPVLLTLLSLGHQLVIVAWTTTISSDAAYYLADAENRVRPPSDRTLGPPPGGIHPLYPYLVSLLSRVLGNVVAAGYAISVGATSLGVIAVYWVSRVYWNDRVALWTGLIYACHPELAREGSEIMSTGLFLSLFTTSFALFAIAIRKPHGLLFAAAGMAGGLAFLTRPEGIYLALFLVIVPIEAARRWIHREGGCAPLLRGAALGGMFLALIVVGYLFTLHQKTGLWNLTERATASTLFRKLGGQGDSIRDSAAVEWPRPALSWFLKRSATKMLGAFYPGLFPFLILGLGWGWKTAGRWTQTWFFWALIVLALLPPLAAFYLDRHLSPSLRYFLPSTVLLLPWSALGVLVLGDWAKMRVRRPWVFPAVAGLVIVLLLSRSLRPRRPEESSMVNAGAWLRSHSPPAPYKILSTTDKFGFYGRCQTLPLPYWDGTPRTERIGRRPEDLEVPGNVYDALSYYRFQRASFLVLDEKSLRHLVPGYQEWLGKIGFELQARFPQRPEPHRDSVWIYELKGLQD